MARNRFTAFLLFSLLSLSLAAQSSGRPQNRPEYYADRIHFGFYLGINKTNFQITNVNNWHSIAGDSL